MQYHPRPYSNPRAPQHEPEEIELPPPEVRSALAFVSICNEHMKPIPYDVGTRNEALGSQDYTSEFHYPDFLPSQQSAFDKACRCLGKYFEAF